MLNSILAKPREYALHDGERFLDAVQNARLVANAERYYRIMYYGSRASWNLRDSHMFDTLKTLLRLLRAATPRRSCGRTTRTSATRGRPRCPCAGEHNIGQLCRAEFGTGAYLVGFGTDHGTVAAASDWDGPVEFKAVRPALAQQLRAAVPHAARGARAAGSSCCRSARALAPELREALTKPRLERAIGVIYRPETELASHYFQAVLPQQFDEYIWFDETRAVTPFDTVQLEGLPDTYPFGV